MTLRSMRIAADEDAFLGTARRLAIVPNVWSRFGKEFEEPSCLAVGGTRRISRFRWPAEAQQP